jgi:hypothetical protein
MFNSAKIVLSPQEQQLVANTEWILTKHAIIEKVFQLFGNLATSYTEQAEAMRTILPDVIFSAPPKISKGEQYLQLPYVVLDFPRHYEKDNMLAIRTMFWWGHFISISLHVSGRYKQLLEQSLFDKKDDMNEQLFLCVSNEQWHHHFEPTNYVALAKLSTEEVVSIVSQQPFIKVAAKYSLQQWIGIPLALDEMFNKMLLMLRP